MRRALVTQRSAAKAKSRHTVEGEYPEMSWPSLHEDKAVRKSYAPSVYRMKLWPSKALIGTWFPLIAAEHTTRFEDSTVVERSCNQKATS